MIPLNWGIESIIGRRQICNSYGKKDDHQWIIAANDKDEKENERETSQNSNKNENMEEIKFN